MWCLAGRCCPSPWNRGTVDRWHAREAPRGKLRGQRTRPWIKVAERRSARESGLVGGVGLRRGDGHATAVRPDPSTLGAVGAWEGSRREDCSRSGSGCRAQPDGWGSLGRPRRARPGYSSTSAWTWEISALRSSRSPSWSWRRVRASRTTSLAGDGQVVELCLSGDAAKPLPLLSGQVDGAALVRLAAGGWHAPSRPTLRCLRESKRRGVGMAASRPGQVARPAP
jgi:hypothetical protein